MMRRYLNDNIRRFADKYAMPAQKLEPMNTCNAAILSLKEQLII